MACMARMRPPNRVSGSSPQANWLNQLLEYCVSLSPQPSPGMLTDHTVRGVSRRARAQAVTAGTDGSRTKQFLLKEVKGDYLKCLPYETGLAIPGDDYDPEDIVLIGKPPELQKSLFHGQTVDGWLYDVLDVTPPGGTLVWEGIRRHATNGLKKEIQQVIPKYRIDWLIYATDNVDGLTGIEWLDINVDGRAFAKTLERVDEDGIFGAPDP